MVATTGPIKKVALRNYKSDGCNNRAECVRLHEGPYGKGLGSEVVLTGPDTETARGVWQISWLWPIQPDLDHVGPMAAGELHGAV